MIKTTKKGRGKETKRLFTKCHNLIPRTLFLLLLPANEVCEGYVFTGVCLSTGGACVVAGGCVVALGGHVWLLWGHAWLLWGAMHGCSWGGMPGCSGGVHGCSGVCTWLLQGGMHGCLGGMHGCSQGGGVCVVAPGGHAWLLWGGMCGCSGGHAWLLGGACVVAPGGHAWFLGGGVRGFFHEIRSMSGRYASYWNAFLF